ncbi:MAG: sulfite exporter TauE/SafE family protein [Mariprofundaceae bacterium]
MPEFELLHLGYGLLTGLLAGSAGGVLAGLAGLGGGFIYVPALYMLLARNDAGIALAIMTSLIAVFLTGLFSSRAHWRLQHIDTGLGYRFIPWLAGGASAGLWFTLRVPEAAVLAGLAMLDAWVAWDMGREQRWRSPFALSSLGLPIGAVSGMFGIGGGTMLVPLLRRFVALRYAVGTSAFCGAIMAGLAVLVNIAAENRWAALIGDHLYSVTGFLAGVAIVLPASSRLAASLHQSVPENLMRSVLRFVFASLAVVLATVALIKFIQG